MIRSFNYSKEGISTVWHKEQSFRLEVYACLLIIPLVFLLSAPKIEKLLLILLILFLLVTELINSAVEAVVDRISTDIHPLSKLAKDACSAAVGLAILMNIIAWLFILF